MNHRWYGNLFRGRYKTRRIIQTVLFLSGSGTPAPILDFKSLYALSEDEKKLYRAIASRNTVNVDVIDKIFVLSDKSGE